MRGTKSTWLKSLAIAWALLLGLQLCLPVAAQGRLPQSPVAELSEAGLQAAAGFQKDALGVDAFVAFAACDRSVQRPLVRADGPLSRDAGARSALLPTTGCFPAAP